jgi:hypothetical protein
MLHINQHKPSPVHNPNMAKVGLVELQDVVDHKQEKCARTTSGCVTKQHLTPPLLSQ